MTTLEKKRQWNRQGFTKNRKRYKALGWKDLRFLLPPDIKEKVYQYKEQLMQEFWAKYHAQVTNDNK